MDFYDPAIPTEEVDTPCGSPGPGKMEEETKAELDKNPTSTLELSDEKQQKDTTSELVESTEKGNQKVEPQCPVSAAPKQTMTESHLENNCIVPTDIPLPGNTMVSDVFKTNSLDILVDIPLPPMPGVPPRTVSSGTSVSAVKREESPPPPPQKNVTTYRPSIKIAVSGVKNKPAYNPHALGFEGKSRPPSVSFGAKNKGKTNTSVKDNAVPTAIPLPTDIKNANLISDAAKTNALHTGIPNVVNEQAAPSGIPPPPNSDIASVVDTVKPAEPEPVLRPAQKLIFEARANQKHAGLSSAGGNSLGKQKRSGVNRNTPKESADAKVCFQIKSMKRLVAYTDDSESPTEGEDTSESDVNPSPVRPISKLAMKNVETNLEAVEQEILKQTVKDETTILSTDNLKPGLVTYPLFSKTKQQKQLVNQVAHQIQEKLNTNKTEEHYKYKQGFDEEAKEEINSPDQLSQRNEPEKRSHSQHGERSKSSDRRHRHVSRSSSPEERHNTVHSRKGRGKSRSPDYRHRRRSFTPERRTSPSHSRKRNKSPARRRKYGDRNDRSHTPEVKHKSRSERNDRRQKSPAHQNSPTRVQRNEKSLRSASPEMGSRQKSVSPETRSTSPVRSRRRDRSPRRSSPYSKHTSKSQERSARHDRNHTSDQKNEKLPRHHSDSPEPRERPQSVGQELLHQRSDSPDVRHASPTRRRRDTSPRQHSPRSKSRNKSQDRGHRYLDHKNEKSSRRSSASPEPPRRPRSAASRHEEDLRVDPDGQLSKDNSSKRKGQYLNVSKGRDRSTSQEKIVVHPKTHNAHAKEQKQKTVPSGKVSNHTSKSLSEQTETTSPKFKKEVKQQVKVVHVDSSSSSSSSSEGSDDSDSSSDSSDSSDDESESMNEVDASSLVKKQSSTQNTSTVLPLKDDEKADDPGFLIKNQINAEKDKISHHFSQSKDLKPKEISDYSLSSTSNKGEKKRMHAKEIKLYPVEKDISEDVQITNSSQLTKGDLVEKSYSTDVPKKCEPKESKSLKQSIDPETVPVFNTKGDIAEKKFPINVSNMPHHKEKDKHFPLDDIPEPKHQGNLAEKHASVNVLSIPIPKDKGRTQEKKTPIDLDIPKPEERGGGKQLPVDVLDIPVPKPKDVAAKQFPIDLSGIPEPRRDVNVVKKVCEAEQKQCIDLISIPVPKPKDAREVKQISSDALNIPDPKENQLSIVPKSNDCLVHKESDDILDIPPPPPKDDFPLKETSNESQKSDQPKPIESLVSKRTLNIQLAMKPLQQKPTLTFSLAIKTSRLKPSVFGEDVDAETRYRPKDLVVCSPDMSEHKDTHDTASSSVLIPVNCTGEDPTADSKVVCEDARDLDENLNESLEDGQIPDGNSPFQPQSDDKLVEEKQEMPVENPNEESLHSQQSHQADRNKRSRSRERRSRSREQFRRRSRSGSPDRRGRNSPRYGYDGRRSSRRGDYGGRNRYRGRRDQRDDHHSRGRDSYRKRRSRSRDRKSLSPARRDRSYSPTRKRSQSPRRDHTSPKRRSVSPRRRSLSRRRSPSPRRRSISPRRRSPSPRRRIVSPRRRSISPQRRRRRRSSSPRRFSKSPRGRSKSPRRRTSISPRQNRSQHKDRFSSPNYQHPSNRNNNTPHHGFDDRTSKDMSMSPGTPLQDESSNDSTHVSSSMAGRGPVDEIPMPRSMSAMQPSIPQHLTQGMQHVHPHYSPAPPAPYQTPHGIQNQVYQQQMAPAAPAPIYPNQMPVHASQQPAHQAHQIPPLLPPHLHPGQQHQHGHPGQPLLHPNQQPVIKPLLDQPLSHHAPIHQPSGHQQPGHQQSGHQPPVHQPLLHQPMGHQPPVHQPVGHQPLFHQPPVHQPLIHQPQGGQALLQPPYQQPYDDQGYYPRPPQRSVTQPKPDERNQGYIGLPAIPLPHVPPPERKEPTSSGQIPVIGQQVPSLLNKKVTPHKSPPALSATSSTMKTPLLKFKLLARQASDTSPPKDSAVEVEKVKADMPVPQQNKVVVSSNVFGEDEESRFKLTRLDDPAHVVAEAVRDKMVTVTLATSTTATDTLLNSVLSRNLKADGNESKTVVTDSISTSYSSTSTSTVLKEMRAQPTDPTISRETGENCGDDQKAGSVSLPPVLRRLMTDALFADNSIITGETDSGKKRKTADSEESDADSSNRRRSRRLKSLETTKKQETDERAPNIQEKKKQEQEEQQVPKRKEKPDVAEVKDTPGKSIAGAHGQVMISFTQETSIPLPARQSVLDTDNLLTSPSPSKVWKLKSRWSRACEMETTSDVPASPTSTPIVPSSTSESKMKTADEEAIDHPAWDPTADVTVKLSDQKNALMAANDNTAAKDFKVPVLKLERLDSDTKSKDVPLSPRKDAEEEQKTIKPPYFEPIEDNFFLSDRKRSKGMKEVRRMVCDCTTSREDRAMDMVPCGEDCLNRMLMIECGSRCPCGDYCTNKRFQRKQYSKTEPFQTSWKGWGLQASEDMTDNQFVMEYLGEVLDYKQFKSRTKMYAKDSQQHYYFMALNSDEIIDATLKGNISRFINHSCDPNCETQKWTVNGQLRVGFFTRKPIEKGTELTFDYQFENYGEEAQKCFCGTEKCRGFLGGKKRSLKTLEKTPRRKASVEKRSQIFDDILLEEDIQEMARVGDGLRNKNSVLQLARLMVRAESDEHRIALLKIIQDTKESACLRLFLDYHGLSLIWSWMADAGPGSLGFKQEILKTLKILPITNKTILQDSKVLSVVTKWSSEVFTSEKENSGTDTPSANSGNETPSRSETPLSVVGGRRRTSIDSIKSVDTTMKDKTEESSQEGSAPETFDKTPSKKRFLQRLREIGDSGSDSEVSESSRMSGGRSDLDSVSSSILTTSMLGDSLSSNLMVSSVFGDSLNASSTLKTGSTLTIPEEGSEAAVSETNSSLEVSTSEDNKNMSAVMDGSGDNVTQEEKAISDEKKVDIDIGQGDSQISDEGAPEKSEAKENNLNSLASELLEAWQGLKEIFKIPKKEQIEERKKTERELDTRYKEQDRYRDRDYDRYGKRRRDDSPESKSRKKDRKFRKSTDDDYDSGKPRKVLLPTPPKMTKQERRQLFEAQMKAKEELAKIQEQQQRDQEQEMMQDAGIMQEGMMQGHAMMQDQGMMQDVAYQQGVPGYQGFYQGEAGFQDPSGQVYMDQQQYMDPNNPQYVEQSHFTEAQTPAQIVYQAATQAASQQAFQQSYQAQSGYPSQTQFVANTPVYFAQPTPQGVVMQAAYNPTPQTPAPTQVIQITEQALQSIPVQQIQQLLQQQPQLASQFVKPSEGDDPPPPPSPPRPKQSKLPPNWKTAKDAEGKVYYYHTTTRETQWEAPSWDGVEKEEAEPEMISGDPRKKRASSTTTAAADTSSEVAKRCKEHFRVKMSTYIVSCLNPFRKPDCKLGRITSTDDFKHLARKLTHAVLAKELKHCKHPEDLEVNENVKAKAKDYVKKYMHKYGKIYKKEDESYRKEDESFEN